MTVTWIRQFTDNLLYHCTVPGSQQLLMDQVCTRLHQAWCYACELNRQIDYAGFSHHNVVYLFMGICRPVMDQVFASDQHSPSLSPSLLTATYTMPMRRLFNQLQHVFQSPNHRVGDTGTFTRGFQDMSHAEIDTMLAPWRTHLQDGMEEAEAEAASFEMLKQNVHQLFCREGGLSMARSAMSEFDSYHYATQWMAAMDDRNLDLPLWSREFWNQKLYLLNTALWREARDYITNLRSGTRTVHARLCVQQMVFYWDPSRTRPPSEFTREHVIGHDTDRTFIEGLFNQLPNADSRWIKGRNTSLSMLNTAPAVSPDMFNSISELVAYTNRIILALEPLRISMQLNALHTSQQQSNQALGQLTNEVLAKKNQELERELESMRRKRDKEAQSKGVNQITVNTMDCVYSRASDQGTGILLDGLFTIQPYQPVAASSPPGQGSLGLDTDANELPDSSSVLLVNTISHEQQAEHNTENILRDLALKRSELIDLYPGSMCTQLHLTRRGLPPNSVSIASLLHAIKMWPDKVVAQEHLSQLCLIIQSVVSKLGSQQPITDRDLDSCKCPIAPSRHVNKGSHCTQACPQAHWHGMGGSPLFSNTYASLTPESFMQICQAFRNDKHDPATCPAKEGHYGRCGNVQKYLYQNVYPHMYGEMIKRLYDPQTSEVDKQAYRVNLACGALTMAWSKLPVVA